MSKKIQLRNVPDQLYATLKARAAAAGMPLSRYLLSEICEIADRPTLDELQARLDARPRVKLSVPPAVLVRRMRDAL